MLNRVAEPLGEVEVGGYGAEQLVGDGVDALWLGQGFNLVVNSVLGYR